jgi:DNA (cytosine-5)-methyltransferase 1
VILLDLFCKAGCGAVGYRRAGFAEIVGVDVEPQPRYPFAQKRAMGVDWEITLQELTEGIPPAYIEHVGRQLLAA